MRIMVRRKSRNFILFWSLVAIMVLILFYKYRNSSTSNILPFKSFKQSQFNHEYNLIDTINGPVVRINVNGDSIKKSSHKHVHCSHHTCFNVHKCRKFKDNHIMVYVYPIINYVDSVSGKSLTPTMSHEHREFINTITSRHYFTSDPTEACLFIPSIDLTGFSDSHTMSKSLFNILESLPHWTQSGGGQNHLLFNYNHLNSDLNNGPSHSAMIASTSFDSWSYRPYFDISIPFYHSVQKNYRFKNIGAKKWTLLIPSLDSFPSDEQLILNQLEEDYVDNVKIISDTYANADSGNNNLDIDKNLNQTIQSMKKSRFCLIKADLLPLSLMTNCVPVILMSDDHVLPFEEKINWNMALITIRQDRLINLMEILKTIEYDEYASMAKYGKYIYNKYMSSVSKITLTTIEIINDRLVPYAISDNDDNNLYRHCDDKIQRRKSRRKDVFS